LGHPVDHYSDFFVLGTESDDVTERADIYVGLQLDGVNSYHNISAVNSSIAMQFALKPDLHCLSEDQISFDPEAQSLLPIRVSTAAVDELFLSLSRLGKLCVRVVQQ